jgi:TRAP-type C4-dicarboxylate transport system substrate-binding protein
MKKWGIFLSVLVILSLVMGVMTSCGGSSSTTSAQSTTNPATTTAANKVILRLSVGIPEGDPMVQALFVWAKNFNLAANGKYEMQVYPGGVLAGANDSFASTRNKTFEMGHTSLPVLTGYDPIFGVANLPYCLATYEANNEFCYQSKDYLSKVMETKFNQKLLSSFCMGFADLYTVKKQVKVMEDFKGLVIACDKAIDSKTAELLGGSGVTMDYTEEYQSLQKGIVNAGMATAGGALGFMKYYEVIKYLTLSSKSPGQLGVTINLEVFNSMPADIQKAMVDEGNKYQYAMADTMKKFWMDSYDTVSQHGVTIYNLPADERARWQTACAPISEDYWKQIGPDAAAKMQAMLKAANDKYPYGTNSNLSK